MIAGLWDDLRTDRRAGDDVYMVQDLDRVIFRWQAVTFDTPIGPSETRGEHPDGTGRFPIIMPGAANPDWSLTGSSLAFDTGHAIGIYDRVFNRVLFMTNATGDSRPRYSPNGSQIVFQSSRDGQPEIYVMNADGSSQTRVTTGSDGVWRPLPTTPVLFTEEGTGNAAAINSVTYVRGPFQILDKHNFSVDGHARITLFTSHLGIIAPPTPETFMLSVRANGVILPIEKVGQMSGVAGMSGSYIIVRLPDGLPTGNLSLTITLRGLTSAPTILPIAP